MEYNHEDSITQEPSSKPFVLSLILPEDLETVPDDITNDNILSSDDNPTTQIASLIRYDSIVTPPVQIRIMDHKTNTPLNSPRGASEKNSYNRIPDFTRNLSPTSPNHKRKKRNQELIQIQKALSVSHIYQSSHNTSASERTHHEISATNTELYMEFCWCFSCCFYIPFFRKCLEGFFSEKKGCLNTQLYDWLYTTLFSTINKDHNKALTKTQKLVIVIRICFELYKTMIGSYLTVFTPQKCGVNICTLTQNLIPKDNMEIVALAMNSIMAFSLLCEYFIEVTREKVLRMYFETDPRLPVEKEYFTNLLSILEPKKATLLSEQPYFIRSIFQLYRRIGIMLLSVYVVNICISAAVIYKNYYDKSSFFGFVTNALFIVFKMTSILKIAIHSIKIPYSAYIDSPVAFNSLKPEYIKEDIIGRFYYHIPADEFTPTEYMQYFSENRQYIRFILDNYRTNIELATPYDAKSEIALVDRVEYTVRKRCNSFS
jgi:hypothetical protein